MENSCPKQTDRNTDTGLCVCQCRAGLETGARSDSVGCRNQNQAVYETHVTPVQLSSKSNGQGGCRSRRSHGQWPVALPGIWLRSAQAVRENLGQAEVSPGWRLLNSTDTVPWRGDNLIALVLKSLHLSDRHRPWCLTSVGPTGSWQGGRTAGAGDTVHERCRLFFSLLSCLFETSHNKKPPPLIKNK